MALYLIGIVGGDIAIILYNIFFGKGEIMNFSLMNKIIAGILLPVGLIAIDGVFAFAIRRLPEKWFGYDVKFHKVSKGETKFYEHLGVKLWKDHVLELGMFTAFSKKKISDPKSKEYLERFILECNYGAWIHIADVIFGWLLCIIYPSEYFLSFTLPASIINSVLNILPFMILRYNLPRLERMRVIAVGKEELARKLKEKKEN